MIKISTLGAQLEQHIQEVIHESSETGIQIWKLILGHHPADIATIFEYISAPEQALLLQKISKEIAPKIFERMSGLSQAALLEHLEKDFIALILQQMHSDRLTHLFDYISDDQLQEYLKLLQRKQRNQIVSSLNFAVKSAGRLMSSDVLTFPRDFTVKKSIALLQRLGPKRDILQSIYLTDEQNLLVGFINIQDLVLNNAETPLMSIMKPCSFVAQVNDDQEHVAQQMNHYNLIAVPVVNDQNYFLGVVTADDIFDVLEDEATEEVYKMSGLSAIEDSYLETPFWTLIQQRSNWLVSLLFLQSISGVIMAHFSSIYEKYTILAFFITMLIGTGGNAGNQSATLIIRGLSTGEINKKTTLKALFKELNSATVIGFILSFACFIRVYFYSHDFLMATTISIVLFLIVLCSILFGTTLPIVLHRCGVDPAHSAAPFLATIMDICGILILCLVTSIMLG